VISSVELVELTAEQMRLLPPSAWKLLRVLLRDRDRAGRDPANFESTDDYFLSLLRSAAERAGIGYSTAQRALAILRRAGIIMTERNVVERMLVEHVDQFSPFMPTEDGELKRLPEGAERLQGEVTRIEYVNALERNWYSVLGAWRVVKGVDHVSVPRAAWELFEQAGDGRKASEHVPMNMIVPWKSELQELDSRVEAAKKALRIENMQRRTVGLPPVDEVSNNLLSSKNHSLNPKGFRESAQQVLTGLTKAEGVDIDKLFQATITTKQRKGLTWRTETVALGGMGYDPHKTARLAAAAPYAWSQPTDIPRRTQTKIEWCKAHVTPEERARVLVEGYRRAVWKIYGQRWFLFPKKSDLRKSKHWHKLNAAADMCMEHSVAPEHWAIWRLRWFSESVSGFKNAAPPIWLVMNPKTIAERAGWYRKDYELPRPMIVLEDLHTVREQRCRNEEALHIAAGYENSHRMMWAPTWYRELREIEIAQGYEQPHVQWPRLDGTRKAPPVRKYDVVEFRLESIERELERKFGTAVAA